jgi:polysaccharide biosynthesis/export protein
MVVKCINFVAATLISDEPYKKQASMIQFMCRLSAFLFLLGSLSSCIQHRELQNFNEGPAFPTVENIGPLPSLLLQPDDILSISIQSEDPEASAPFNFSAYPAAADPGTSGAMATSSKIGAGPASGPATYLIDANGEVNFPVIGKIKAAGLSTLQLRDTLTQRISRFINRPIINVRLTNFRVTLLGEVQRSGTYSFPNERVNILEALGTAGDITNYGDREQVLVIREENGQREYHYLNLHQKDVFRSPCFYLQQNDVIYVRPLRAKVGSTTDETSKYLQWAFPVISLVSIIISLTK